MPVVEEAVVAKAVTTSAAAPVSVSETKKSKQMVKSRKDSPDLTGLLEMIQEAVLTKDDLQTLVDSILARQSEDSWTTKSTKQDPLTLLRKQLEEAQANLEAERANSSSAQAKIKEMNSKVLSAERTSSTATQQIQEMQVNLFLSLNSPNSLFLSLSVLDLTTIMTKQY